MGIADLWKVINVSEKSYTIEQIAYNQEERTKGRNLRVAVDIALWIFQVRSSNIGEQSELRAMFFRFCKLYELGIRPVFVFDGHKRPGYKRNKMINTVPINTEFRRQLLSLICLFRFASWDAYGEAEAECAMLQRLGFVDVVFTGDSDVFLFGARRVIRNWPSKRHEPVACYDMGWITETTGLDRSDLILIALLRGSDYDNGTKGIGIQVAAQLSQCHFHRELMDDIQIAGRQPLDNERVQHLYDDLMYELEHNSKKKLGRKHSGVVLDPTFPDFSIVIDFIHPLTRIAEKDNLAQAKILEGFLNRLQEPDWANLAAFAQQSFVWPADYLLKRFSSLLFPGYMANRLRSQQPSYQSSLRKVIPNSQKRYQTVLGDYYRSTRQRHTTEVNDVLHITASKVRDDLIKLYRVEWNPESWKKFLEKLKPKLDFSLVVNLNSQMGDEEEDGGILQCNKIVSEKDQWQNLKRQWINATQIHHVYPKVALSFKESLSDPKRKSQTKLDSFLIIPPKRKTL